MDAEHAIRERVDRFVEEILDLIRRVEKESRATALQKVQVMLGDGAPTLQSSRTMRSPRRAPTSSSKAPKPAVPIPSRALNAAPIQAGTANGSASTVSPLQAGSLSTGATSTAGTGNGTPTEREARVLEAVRSLVRGTTGQIAERSGLPNGTVYVVLKTLGGAKRVARTETPRGIEYSLASSGGVGAR